MDDPREKRDPLELGNRPPVNPPSPSPGPEIAEDTGSQALSEALRSSFVIVKIIMVLLVIVFFASGVFTVPSQERAILLRFGRPVGTGEEMLLGPGLHWSFPYPIDEVVRIPSGQIQTVRSTVGWYATTPEMELAGTEPPPGLSLNPATDGYTLTSDTNIIHVRATLDYRITDPLSYELSFVNASNMVQNALNNAVLYSSSRFTVDQVLREETLAFQESVVQRVRDLVSEQQLGITVVQGVVSAIAPRQVQASFEQVLTAEVGRRQEINDAEAYANRIVSTARGETNRIINAAQTRRIREIEEIAAEAKYFQDQLPHYRRSPELFMAQVRADMLSRAITNTQSKFVVPRRGDGNPREVRLQLSRPPRGPTIGAPQ